MSDNRSEKPTQRRLEQARREGRVAVSPAAAVAAGFVLPLLVATLLLPRAALHLIGNARSLIEAGAGAQPAALARAAHESLLLVMTIVAPLALAALLGVVAVGAAQTGGLVLRPPRSGWSSSAFAERLKLMAPTPQAFWRLSSDALKLLLIGAVSLSYLWQHAPELLALAGTSPQGLIRQGAALGFQLALRLACVLVLCGLAGVVRARYVHWRSLRMSKQELRDELRLSEGDPRLKSRRRDRGRELLSRLRRESLNERAMKVED